jgi:hypothetical protein
MREAGWSRALHTADLPFAHQTHAYIHTHTSHTQEKHTALCENDSKIPNGLWFGAAAAATAIGTALALAAKQSMQEEQEKIGVWRDRYTLMYIRMIFVRV